MAEQPSIQALAIDLAWSLVSELGIRGPRRRHSAWVVDPEWCVLLGLHVAHGHDARLAGELGAWMSVHASTLATRRFDGLVHRAGDRTVDAVRSVRQTARDRGHHLDVRERPSLAWLRLRSAFGPVAKTDVLGWMLAMPNRRVVARDLEHEGYTKRPIAVALAALDDAGILASESAGNRLEYRLARADTVLDLCGGQALVWLRWRSLFKLVEYALLWEDGAHHGEATRRVDAVRTGKAMALFAEELGLPAPPRLVGQPSAAADLQAWIVQSLRMLGHAELPFLSS